MGKLEIFDMTLRDGEQSPGFSMGSKEKLSIAKALDVLRIDAFEAGFAASSIGDFEAIKQIALEIKHTTVSSLSRAMKNDIDISWEALKPAVSPRIHIFLATSEIHMKYKLKKSPTEVLAMAVRAVEYARSLSKKIEIQFSAEDATRSDQNYLVKIFKEVITAGANIVNISDTVGYSVPNEMYALVNKIKKSIPSEIKLSVHCHNDLGLALANSVAAVQAEVNQCETTISGIGERAGICDMEKLVEVIRSRSELFNCIPRVKLEGLEDIKRKVFRILPANSDLECG